MTMDHEKSNEIPLEKNLTTHLSSILSEKGSVKKKLSKNLQVGGEVAAVEEAAAVRGVGQQEVIDVLNINYSSQLRDNLQQRLTATNPMCVAELEVWRVKDWAEKKCIERESKRMKCKKETERAIRSQRDTKRDRKRHKETEKDRHSQEKSCKEA